VKESGDPIAVEDPANPTGNDLSGLLKAQWLELSLASSNTLDLLERSEWEAVFGTVDGGDRGGTSTERLKSAAASVVTPTKPWLSEA
jgi:hypothetical protein